MSNSSLRRIALLFFVLAASIAFADDATPTISSDDAVPILKLQKQQSDVKAQYNKLYAEFLQSQPVVSLQATSMVINNSLGAAMNKAMDDAKIDKTKFTLDQETLKPVPLKGPAK